MTDPQRSRHQNALELDKILALLAEQATLPEAAELARALTPGESLEEVAVRLEETQAACTLLARFGAPSFGGAASVSAAVARAQAGGVLTPRELLDFGETLRVVRAVRDWSVRAGSEAADRLRLYFDALTPNPYFENRIFLCIKSEDEMQDSASPALADLRRKIRNATRSIREKLDGMIRSQSYAGFLQEAIVTQRDGRFVVPVKAEHRGDVPGLVHDTSGSGATLFIEPMAVVEINNDLRVLQKREQEEIERILAELSREAASFGAATEASYEALVQLNFLFAKAHLADRMKAAAPRLNAQGRIVLNRARHPLIPAAQAVPISVTLGVEFDSLIITGPNTGGKTVTLKTIGLLTLMALCGLWIPAAEGSEIAFFERILADIGDEQSIEQSLSTFSAHMKNLVSILEQADEHSLVLLDELGAGTDPVEGAALARAILQSLARKGVRLAATTHYAELKSYALDTPRVENASCEFDVETLRPTYRLLIGMPGRSNAFAISTRLGLDPAIVSEAQGYLSEEHTRFERVVASLEEARSVAEREREEAQTLREDLARSREKAEQARAAFERERTRALDEARQQASRLLDRTRAQANRLLEELETLKKEATAGNAAEQLQRARQSVRGGLNRLEETVDPVDRRDAPGQAPPRPLKVGDRVLLRELNKEADVLDVRDKEAFVLAGILKTWVPLTELKLLERAPEPPAKAERRVRGVATRAERSVSAELDLRGMAADEAILALDRYLDDALLSGVPSVTVIHGKGTGVLRREVRGHLRGHKSVRTFRPGVFGEGEDGVTIVELAN